MTDQQKLLVFISKHFADGKPVAHDQDLLGGLVDSLGVFALVEFIESEFGVRLDDGDLTIENLNRVDAICGLLAQRRPST
jgi:acyl carrier protein